MKELARRARAYGKTSVLGGSSVSAAPEQYPEFDYLHLGELGDATDELISRIDEDVTPPRGAAPLRHYRAPAELADFPGPAYRLIDGRRYFYRQRSVFERLPLICCEFCDIPALYGRQPRLKTPEQIVAELDALIAAGIKTSIYFVDDNYSSATRRRRVLYCRTSLLGKSAVAIRCSCAARQPSISRRARIS